MPFEIVFRDDSYTYGYGSFLSHNPWFDYYMNKRLDNHTEEIKRNLRSDFPRLWHEQAIGSEAWTAFKHKIDTETFSCINKVRDATTARVAELEDSQALHCIKSAVLEANAQADLKRNERLEQLESRVSQVQSGQVLTFVSGGFVAAALFSIFKF